MEGEGAVPVTCYACGMFMFLPEYINSYICSKCKMISLLEEKVRKLEARLSTLKNIRELEAFLDTEHQTMLSKRHAGDEPVHDISEEVESEGQKGDAWRNVTQRSRRPREQSLNLELQNRFEVLSLINDGEQQEQEEDKWIVLDGCMGDAPKDKICSDTEETDSQSSENFQTIVDDSPWRVASGRPQKRRVVVVGDSLLRGTEAIVCGPDKMSREVCCLPGAKIRDVTERLTRLVKPTDRNPFLLVHVGTNDTARHSLQKIRRDFEDLGRKLKDLGTQVVISSLLPVKGRGPGRERKIVEVNNWLRKWCRQERFGFLDHGLWFHEDGLLARDGLHLTSVGRNIFAKRLANLIRRALN